MKKVLIFDELGNYIEDKITDDDNYIALKNEFVTEINTPLSFYKPILVSGEVVEGLTQGEIDELTGNSLELIKKSKLEELRLACESDILNGFTHIIDGIEYHFSFDIEAQMNFNGANNFFIEGLITEIEWTVKLNDKYMRITLNKNQFNEIKLKAFNEKDRKIKKLRNDLQPLVESATTKDEVALIKW